MRSRRWDYYEDEMVCEFYLAHIDNFRKNIDDLLLKFIDAGYNDRDKNAILMRLSNFQFIHIGKGLSKYSKQSKKVFDEKFR